MTLTSECVQWSADGHAALPEVTVEVIGQWVLACRTLSRGGRAFGRWSISDIVRVSLASVGLECREAARNLSTACLA